MLTSETVPLPEPEGRRQEKQTPSSIAGRTGNAGASDDEAPDRRVMDAIRRRHKTVSDVVGGSRARHGHSWRPAQARNDNLAYNEFRGHASGTLAFDVWHKYGPEHEKTSRCLRCAGRGAMVFTEAWRRAMQALFDI